LISKYLNNKDQVRRKIVLTYKVSPKTITPTAQSCWSIYAGLKYARYFRWILKSYSNIIV